MSKYDVRPMTLDDYDALLRATTPEAPLWELLKPVHLDHLLKAESWTGLVDDTLVACGGIIPVWSGLAEAWIALTPTAKAHVSFVYRHAKAFLDVVTDSYQLRRIEAHVNADFDAAFRFASRLGFKVDAPLQKYGPNGETFLLMSKVN